MRVTVQQRKCWRYDLSGCTCTIRRDVGMKREMPVRSSLAGDVSGEALFTPARVASGSHMGEVHGLGHCVSW